MIEETLPSLVGKLLQTNRIAFDKTELAFQIQSHPSYPSLHSVTGVLDHFKVENIAATVPASKTTLDQLPDSFMAQLDSDLVVATKTKNGLRIYDSSTKGQVLSAEEFLEKFTGIVVAAESTEETVVPEKPSYLSNIIWAAAGLTFLAMLVIAGATITAYLFLGLFLAGTAISAAILKQESGENSTLGNAFCGEASEKKDCDAVLNSNGASILGKYKFSDLSITYFLSLSLVSVIGILQASELTIIYFATLLSLPVTLYSIYYQWLVVKKWCLLCLSIVAILWIQASLTFYLADFAVVPNTLNVLLPGLISLVVFAGWTYLRAKQEALRKGQNSQVAYQKFKRNFDLFSTLLYSGEAIDTSIYDPLEIVLGNSKAPTELTIVTNPFCIHCKDVHKQVEEILGKYRDLIKITIRFNIRLEDEDSDLVRIVTRLIELNEAQGKDICLMAMSEIYGESTSEEWLEKWSDCEEPKPYIALLKKSKNWCVENKINFTPEIRINGFSFPKAYDRPDLIYFIEELHEAALASAEIAESQQEITA